VRISLFSTAMAAKDSNLTLEFALDYLKNASDLPSAYNRVAYQLAEQGMLLDSALVFIDRAEAEFEKAQGRKRVPFMDTKAFVHYKRGEYKQALGTQKEALAIWPKDREWDPNYSEYFYNLALYMYKNGLRDESLKLMARNSFFGMEDATKMLDEILESENKTDDKLTIYQSAADEYLNAAPDKNTARSIVAMGWAKQNILLDKALEFAQAGVDAINENTSFDEQSNRLTTLGVVNVIKNNFKKGISDLEQAKKFSSPYNTDLFFYLGKAYKAVNDDRKAFETYLAGVVGYKPPTLVDRLTTLHTKLYPTGPALEEIVGAETKTVENFKVDKYKKPAGNQKIALAELFTGSECRPCVAADVAYDKLLERYDFNNLAVLEYHQHIPAPDPMTNYDTEARAKFYGVNSTPTSIIEGVEKATSGGPKVAAKNRFDVFSATVEKYLSKSPKAKIDLKTKSYKNNISIDCNATIGENLSKNLKLHVVLAEEKVQFKGYNTISEHRFVVRKMFPSAEGTNFGEKNQIKYSTTLDVKAIEDSLKNYVDGIEKKAGRKVFKEKKFKLDGKNLFVLAFVQNSENKEILQAEVKKLGR
jgi:tetratricopeptide (TPR) repeat protein